MLKKLSILFLLITLLLLSSNSLTIERIKKENEILIEEYFEQEQDVQKEVASSKEGYLGILEIPKINLKRGFFDFESDKNNVENGLEVINKYCLPFESCHFILASHSGTAAISFFKNLEKLNRNDSAFLYYHQEKKEYILREIFYQKKNGTISLQETREPELILTTCNKENDEIQNVYIFTEKK